MKYPWLDDYCASRLGAVPESKPTSRAHLWWVGSKFFAVRLKDPQGRDIVNLKIEPSYGAMLGQDYPGSIFPGYHMNKLHWISVDLNGGVPDALFKELIDGSYEAVRRGLSRKEKIRLDALG